MTTESPICSVCKDLKPEHIDLGQAHFSPEVSGHWPYEIEVTRAIPQILSIINIYIVDMLRQAAAGCMTCQIIRDAAIQLDMPQWPTPGEPLMTYLCVWKFYDDGPLYYTASHNDNLSSSDVMDRLVSTTIPTGIMFTDRVQAGRNPPVDVGVMQLRDPDAMSATSLQQASSWWSDSIRIDGEQTQPNILPTRVLDVRKPGDTVYLRDEADIPESWATLSYCRGTSQPLSTEKATLQTRKDGIKIADLPKTFRDAIEVTRYLDIPYLWIDALCISQDSPADRLFELSYMNHIYGNAALNISADYGVDADAGLSSDLRKLSMPKRIGPNLYVCRTLGLPNPWEPNHVGEGAENILNSQAWAFQERALSRHILHFSGNELSFECRKQRRCFCECGSILGLTNLRSSTQLLTDNITPDAWPKLVHEYSKLKLGDGNDALNAIAGLARHVAILNHKTYVAGLWKEDLPRNLLWHSVPGSNRPTDRQQFPSWSWASVDGEIRMLEGSYDGLRVGDALVSHVSHVSKIGCENQYAPSFSDELDDSVNVLQVSGYVTYIPSESLAGFLDAITVLQIKHGEVPRQIMIDYTGLAKHFAEVLGERFKQAACPETAFVQFDDSREFVECVEKGWQMKFLLITITPRHNFLLLRHRDSNPRFGEVVTISERLGLFSCQFQDMSDPVLGFNEILSSGRTTVELV